MLKRAISFIALTCAFAAFTQSASAATFYAPEYGDDRVMAFNAGQGGTLAPLAGSPFSVASGPINGLLGFATTPDRKKGIAGYLFLPGVNGLTVAGDGGVSPAQAKIDLGANGVYDVAVTPDSRFAYAATRNTPAGVRAYAFGENGALTELAGSPFGTLWEFFDVAVTPDQKLLYGTVGMALIAFAVNPDGTLTQIGHVGGGVVALWAATSPDGRFLFVGGETGGNASLHSFAIQPNGELTPVGDPIVTTEPIGQRPAVAPNGRFVYMPENNTDTVSAARINPDGSLTLVGALNGVDADSIVVSPDSKRMYLSNDDSGQLAVSTIGADGIPGPPQDITPYSPSTPPRMHFRTGYGAVADFTSRPATKPLTVNFDGSKSAAKQDGLGDLDWTFGADPVVTGVLQTHTFPKAGVYDVSLTARDAGGCGSERAWLGQTAPCMGSPESTKTIKYDTPPWVTSLSIAPKRIGRRTKARFKLTEKARVTFTVQRPTKGRRVGSSCRKQTRKNRKAKRCTRWVNVKSFRVNGRSGRTNRVKFTGRIGKTKLKRGKYRLRAIAADFAKGKSPQRTVSFRIR